MRPVSYPGPGEAVLADWAVSMTRTYGVVKFVTWQEHDYCKGAARYYVSWSPVSVD